MDSLTQFTLGACVGAITLGPRIGARKAAIVGGLLGTVPDLDVLYPYADPVDSFTLHRGPTHSLVVQALATPIFAEGVLRLFKTFRDGGAGAHRLRVYLGIYLIFATHALLDAMTIYGTKLFWPLYPEPLGVGSIFILDPLYTIPLLTLTIWALLQNRWGPKIQRGLTTAFVISTAYLGWTLGGQQIAESRAMAAVGGLQEEDRVWATPTPLNTLFWRVMVLRGDDYINVYVPILGGQEDVTIYTHPRNWRALSCAQDVPAVQQIATFSKGFVRLERGTDNRIQIADLRMGITPGYVFRFVIANADGTPIPVERKPRGEANDGDFEWLGAGITGQGMTRAVEDALNESHASC